MAIKIYDDVWPIRYYLTTAIGDFIIDSDCLGDCLDILVDYLDAKKCYKPMFDIEHIDDAFLDEYLQGGNFGKQTNLAYHDIHVNEVRK